MEIKKQRWINREIAFHIGVQIWTIDDSLDL